MAGLNLADTVVREERDHTQFAILGTPLYMSPETWRGEPATPQSDLYSLGAVIFELCRGRPPWGHLPNEGLLGAVLQGAPPSLKEGTPASATSHP